MTKRIFRSICTAAIAVFLVTMLLIFGVLYDYFSSVQLQQLRNETALAVQGVERLGDDYFDGLSVSDYRITWIAADGTVIYDTASDSGSMENHLEREEIKAALETGHGESSRYSSTRMQRSLYCAQKLTDGTVLRLSVAHSSILLLLLGMMQPILIIVAVVIILAFVLANRLSKRIVEPMNRLNLDDPLSNEGYEELTPLLRRIHNQQSELSKMEANLKQKEVQLEKMEAIRREFTANVSHELKTPLQTISGYSELLKCGLAKAEDVQPFNEKIYNEAQRLISLVEDIINLSHLDEGGRDLQWADIDLYTVTDQVVKSLSDIAAQHEITLSLEGESSTVYAVPQLVHTIVYNLCDNAIKYNHAGGAVTVSVGDALIRVKDTGIGIPQEHMDRVFERFYRVDKSRSKEVGGTGLGLSIVKHAAIIQNAEIKVSSVVGEGTEITVKFEQGRH